MRSDIGVVKNNKKMRNKKILQIIKKLVDTNNYHGEATFECYADGMFTYHIQINDTTFHEICVIDEESCFFNLMFPSDILDSKTISYLSHTIYIDDGMDVLQGSEISYRKDLDDVNYVDVNLN